MSEIRIENVVKTFGDKTAVNNVSLTVADGEFLVLLGPSGCGKTTLLRAVAGLGMADSGRIMIDGRDVTYLPAGERKLSMVFQSYAIFPHMTVRDNIGFGLKMNKAPKDQIKRNVDEAAELLHIEDLLDRRPSDMSGGQRQRVAVARALAMKAEVLLMDEPLSNLDALLRLEMRAELKKLLAEVNATTIYVTHDQIEALSMGDRVAVMKDGDLQQVDVPPVVYDQPKSAFVGSFIGNPPMNFLPGTGDIRDDAFGVNIAGQWLAGGGAGSSALREFAGKPVSVGMRAENMEALHTETSGAIRVTVSVVEPLGAQNLLTVFPGDETTGEQSLKVSTHPTVVVNPGDQLWLRFPTDQIRWFDPASGGAIAG